MGRLIITSSVNAIALWLVVTLLPGVTMTSFNPDFWLAWVASYLLFGLMFGVVNTVLRRAIKIVAFPLYLLTLGLISLLVNGLLFMLVAWVGDLIDFGLAVDGFVSAIFGAVLMGLFGWVINLVLTPFRGASN